MSATGNRPRSAQAPPWAAPTPARPAAARWQRLRCATRARVSATALDRLLAAGVSPQVDPAIALRAQRITAPRSRRRLADGLARVLRDAGADRSELTAVVPTDRYEVRAARAVLTALERRLRDERPVHPRGAALLQTLLIDGTSPLYAAVGPGALGSHLRAAAAALEPDPRSL